MKLRELAERDIGNTDASGLPPGTIGLEGNKAWNACFDAFMRLLGDAEVIGLPCPTCGGEQFIDGATHLPWSKALRQSAELGGEYIRIPCPDCPDTTWVIAPEAWEAARFALACDMGAISDDDDEDANAYHGECLTRILQALLPGARVAEWVRTMKHCKNLLSDVDDADTARPTVWSTDIDVGDDIAILAKQEEVE